MKKGQRPPARAEPSRGPPRSSPPPISPLLERTESPIIVRMDSRAHRESTRLAGVLVAL